MRPEEITALAREYAEENLIFHEDMSNCLRNEYLKIFADEAERVIRFLLRRFCLVEKSEVTERYSYAVNHLNEMKGLGSTVEDRIYNEGELNGKIDLLESLFPEIAKEVEG